MKIECLNGPLCEAENDARILTLTVDAAYASHEIRLGLLTPAGRRYLTPSIALTNGVGEYPLPACALDARGKLLAQIVAQNGAGQVAKSEVFAFPVARSIPCEAAQTAESGLITLGSLHTALNALSSAVAALAPVAISGSYTDLTDRPEIPTVPGTVSSFTNDAGYLTAADVDGNLIADSENPVQSKVIQTALAGKQNTLIFDDIPRSDSSKPVTSSGIYNALAGKLGKYSAKPGDWDLLPASGSNNPVTSGGIYDALLAKQNVLTFDNTPTENSGNPVKSGGVYAAIQGATGVTVDDSFVPGSEYPVQSKVIQTALAGKLATYAADPTAWATGMSQGGTKPMTSGAITDLLMERLYKYAVAPVDWDTWPTANSGKPVTSGGLALMLSQIEAALYYKNNDTFTLQHVPINGHLTSTGKTIFLCVQTPKSLANITSITIDAFTGGLRTADGTDHYVENSTDATDWTDAAAGLSLTATKKGDHVIQIKMEKSTAFTGAVNNNLVGLFCSPVTMRFHTS